MKKKNNRKNKLLLIETWHRNTSDLMESCCTVLSPRLSFLFIKFKMKWWLVPSFCKIINWIIKNYRFFFHIFSSFVLLLIKLTMYLFIYLFFDWQAKMEVDDIFVDLADGIKLLKLLEIISGEKLGKPNNGRMRVHKIENVNKSLAFLHTKVG